ncbi:putative lipid-transfer protein DIR1 [Trifolium pratense]|uniref:putative lipid-transfer protein DIR1 n=1 Tax=Trifolium pratense TaxID=57577 RepID=UPI001E692749|nr:putative lipid-transfer protein DIR1 [Trifolium pratense]XP_045821884.1 putative lipid-transfer protein DIR1 [Trifolium pratense]
MDTYKKVMIVVMLLAISNNIMFANGMTICNMTGEERKQCEPYVSGIININYKIPSHACCSATAKADLQCLCRYKDSRLLSFYGIDPRKALKLPVNCKLVNNFHCK